MLRDRAYIFEVFYQGEWHPGSHPTLISRSTFDRVQVLLGEKHYNAHESVYGGGMVKCGHCGGPVVPEIKRRKTKRGEREYRYYRCAYYSKGDHPRNRASEADFDTVVLDLFARMKVKDKKVHQWIVKALRAKTRHDQKDQQGRLENLLNERSSIAKQRDRLLNLRLVDEIEADTFKAKDGELKAKAAELSLRIEAQGRRQSENAELALKVFELSQALIEKWNSADIPTKRRLLEIVCLNFLFTDATLCPQTRKPFDILAEGLSIHSGRGERI